MRTTLFTGRTKTIWGYVLMIESLLLELSDFKEMLESDVRYSRVAKNYYQDFLPLYEKMNEIFGEEDKE